ncbi:fumarylacetoacetate hydrolase family protein [Neptunicella marina]|uniref:Fumarylacetoacetate hydrolase family protein n=1 Tax=Neptunicella marina TaxID=2125989 RepID=A0A8J6IQ68_9ALTE|nr:fumarylacetoacetate hydrolase family protein [Neptunicella marina]MBC3764504.1 fumarylacetoacetate hydrolase family protein [Neptunicella marina]
MKTIQFNGKSFIPSKIVCIGRNFVAHAQELGNEVPQQMVIFTKPNSSISDELHSFNLEPLHYEAELSFLYQNGRFIAVAFGLDLTKRQTQAFLKSKGLPWERAKAFDGAALFSEFVPIESISDSMSLELYIDNHLVQKGDVGLMINKPLAILNEVNAFMSLADNDVVMTGTPKGVGEIEKGSVFWGRVVSQQQVLVEHRWTAQ